MNEYQTNDSAATPPPADFADVWWIAEHEQLARLSPLLQQAPWLAFDTESNSLYVYQEQVCLMQLNIGGQLVVIDPFALPRSRAGLGPLAEALENPDLPVYLHGGEYDVVCMDRDYGIRVRAIQDSQQAASLLGWKRSGYGAVIEATCGVQLAKAYSDYNWGLRPLDQQALHYAIDDVRYLPQAMDALREEIRAADVEEEWTIANQAVADVQSRPPGFDPAGIWRLKGLSDVPNKHLGIAVALHQWRDQVAQRLNRPPGRVLPNDLIVVLARKAPVNFGMLRHMRLRSALIRDHGEELLAVIKEALHNPPAIPEAPARVSQDPLLRLRENALKHWRRQEAERRGVTTQVVLPARALDYLKRHGSSDLDAVPQFGPKRKILYGPVIQDLVEHAEQSG